MQSQNMAIFIDPFFFSFRMHRVILFTPGLLRPLMGKQAWEHRKSERSIIMVVFMESSLGLLIPAVIAFLCIWIKLGTAGRYRRIAKQLRQMDTAKDKTIRKWRIEFEELSSLRNGVANITIFAERCLQQYRFLGIRLQSWNALSHAGIILCMLSGILLSLGAYWYQLDYRFLILYASAGVICSGAAILMSILIDINGKEEMTLTLLQDYMENRLQPMLASGSYRKEESPTPTRKRRTYLEPEEERVLKEVFQEYLV